MRRCCRVEQEGNPGDARRNLFEQLQPLAGHRALESDETGGVTAWPGQAHDEAAKDGIGNERENDGNGARLLHQRCSRRCALRKNKVGLQRDEFLRKSLQRLRVEGPPSIVDPDVTAVRPPELLEFLPECGEFPSTSPSA